MVYKINVLNTDWFKSGSSVATMPSSVEAHPRDAIIFKTTNLFATIKGMKSYYKNKEQLESFSVSAYIV